MAKRAERRAHRERMRERNRRNYPHWHRAWMFGDTRVRCSRYCCGNPRRWFNDVTIQEQKALDAAEGD